MATQRALGRIEEARITVERNDDIQFYTNFVLDMIRKKNTELVPDIALHYVEIIGAKTSGLGSGEYGSLLSGVSEQLSYAAKGHFSSVDAARTKGLLGDLKPLMARETAELRETYGI